MNYFYESKKMVSRKLTQKKVKIYQAIFKNVTQYQEEQIKKTIFFSSQQIILLAILPSVFLRAGEGETLHTGGILVGNIAKKITIF